MKSSTIKNFYIGAFAASNHDIPWISTDDIGSEAAKYLLDDSWAGQWTRNLMEPENLTLSETTAILSQVLNYPIKYAQVTIESVQRCLALAGATPDVQRELGCFVPLATHREFMRQ